jgi:hypothetical protein
MEFVNDGYQHNESYHITVDAKKILFFNPFGSLRVEFFTHHENYCCDLLSNGLSSLCLCNPVWRDAILGRGLQVRMSPGSNRANTYFLQHVQVWEAPEGFFSLKVSTVDEVFDAAYYRMIHQRATYYTESGIEDVWNNMAQHAGVLQQSAYVLKPTFYDWTRGGIYKPCVSNRPLDVHW